MPVTLDQFIQNLVASGLMTAEGVSEFQDSISPEKRPKDAQGFARLLYQQGKLTKYQATAVYGGKTRGLLLGEYEVLDQIGAGGMGEVLKARHRRMDRLVALKVVAPKAMKSPDAVSRFQREVRAAAKLIHQNIVTAYDAREDSGVHYLVMEFVEGQDLATLVKEHGPLSVEQATECIIQAAKGLEFAHSNGIVHRDIKPANLLLDNDGTVKILDMGLARLGSLPDVTDASDPLTTSGQVLGTCTYMAPEQAQDAHGADHRADIYSLGCTLYRLLTGEPPFKGETTIQILLAHQQAPVPSICSVRPDVPAELDAVCHKMMAKEPDDRQESMGEVVAELESCLKPVGVGDDSSTDSALKAFFQNLPQTGAARQEKSGVEETIAYHAEEETAGHVPEQSLSALKNKKWMFIGVGGVVAVLLLIGLVFVSGRGGDDETGGVAVVEEEKETAVEDTQPVQSFVIIEWPEDEREDARLQIDGEPQDMPGLPSPENPNQLKVPVSEGAHTLWLVRRGYEPFERRFTAGAGEEITVEPVWKEFAVGAETEQPEPSMEPVAPEPSTVAETTPETEPEPEEPPPAATTEPDPALLRQQDLEEKYAEALKPVEEKVAEWDFSGAAELLESVRFEEEELTARLATRKDEMQRLAGLKKKIVAKVNATDPPLKKTDLMLRGMGGTVTGSDDVGITATLISGKDESTPWADLSQQATSKLLQLAIDRNSADDWLAGGLLASAAGDAALAEKLLAQARSQGADISPYLVGVAVASFGRALELLEHEEFSEAATLLANIEEKYADTPWFASYKSAVEAAQAKAKAGIYEAEADKLFAEAVGLFKTEQFFDVKPVVEKLKTDFADSVAVTDTTRKPSFAELQEAVADLGGFITVRQDGKGAFTSIQEAIDAAEPNSLIEIEDNGPYGEKLVIPEAKEGLTIRGKEGFLPLVTSFGKEADFAVSLVQVEAHRTTLERLLIVHASVIGGNARCICTGGATSTPFGAGVRAAE